MGQICVAAHLAFDLCSSVKGLVAGALAPHHLPMAFSYITLLAGLVAACALPMAPLPLELAVSAGVAGALGYGLVYILSMLRAMAPPEPFRGAR